MGLPREGKKLLVLDVDYTFFDHRSTVSNPLVLRRPYIETLLVHDFQIRVHLWTMTHGVGKSVPVLRYHDLVCHHDEVDRAQSR